MEESDIQARIKAEARDRWDRLELLLRDLQRRVEVLERLEKHKKQVKK